MLELLSSILKPIGSATGTYILVSAGAKVAQVIILFLFLVALFIRFAF